jgi:hypothetical protein
MPLASLVRTLVSLVDVPDVNGLRALAGTPFNVLDSAASSQHARVLRTSGTDIGNTVRNRLLFMRVVAGRQYPWEVTRSGGEWMSSTLKQRMFNLRWIAGCLRLRG